MPPDKKPQITVVIPTFNRGEYLAECLESILDQSLPASQIIVVNNGSTDNTKEICRAFSNKTDYFETEQLGKPGAINFGLGKVTGDYVWIFDDDDVALCDALERLVYPLENNPEYGFSYCTFFFTATDTTNNQIGEVISEYKIPDLERRGFLVSLLDANFLGGAALFARTACYGEVGLFDPRLLRSQDYEMAIRIARRFSGIPADGGPTFHYRQHGGQRGASMDRFAAVEKDEKWLKYDQMFFIRLYENLPMEDYLPPGLNLPSNKRRALMQRISIMASKSLVEQMIADLHELLLLNDHTGFSREEYTIIWDIVYREYYSGLIDVYSYTDFFDEIRKLSKSSKIIRVLRKEMTRALVARFRGKPGRVEVLGITRLLFHLFLRRPRLSL